MSKYVVVRQNPTKIDQAVAETPDAKVVEKLEGHPNGSVTAIVEFPTGKESEAVAFSFRDDLNGTVHDTYAHARDNARTKSEGQ